MVKKDLLIIADYSEQSTLSLEELCEICGMPDADIHELVTYEILAPTGEVPEQWVFDLAQLQRLRIAMRLQRDLEINLAGIALVLDLLDEIEEHRARAALLERHLLK